MLITVGIVCTTNSAHTLRVCKKLTFKTFCEIIIYKIFAFLINKKRLLIKIWRNCIHMKREKYFKIRTFSLKVENGIINVCKIEKIQSLDFK